MTTKQQNRPLPEAPAAHAATTYAINVRGHLDSHWSARLGRVDMACNDDGTTTITIEAADQAQLHGVLAGLRDIGAVITELRTKDAPIPTCRSTASPGSHMVIDPSS